MPNTTYHVYALLCPEDGLAYYVGKSRAVRNRYKGHIAGARRWLATKDEPRPASQLWIYTLVQRGLKPTLAILETIVAEEETYRGRRKADLQASELEKAWIGRLHNAGHPLTNFNSAVYGEDIEFIETAAERGRNLALSLYGTPVEPADLLDD